MTEAQSVVVLGAGFGGLRTALKLSKSIRKNKLLARVILIDVNPYHTYTPTLYEAATTSKEVTNNIQLKSIITFPIAEILKKQGVEIVQDRVESLDLIGGDIHCAKSEKLKFDYLVIALGSEPHFFGIPGLQSSALTLKSFVDAIKIRDKIWELFAEGRREIQVIIGGGGTTGVELAAEIQGWLPELSEEFKGCSTKVTIVEANPTVLSGFSEKVVNKVYRRLKNIGIETLVHETIEQADREKVFLKNGRVLPYDVLVWTGGVKAVNLIGTLPLKIEKRGRMEVAGEMECLPQSPDLKLYGKIYALGDAVCFYDPVSGKPIPGVARAAISQANIVAHNILCDLKGTGTSKKYRPMNYPYIIPVGGKWAVAKLGPIVISGFLGWVLKGLVEINYLLSIMPFWRAIRTWLKGLRIFVQNDRLG